ncbi:MAG: acyltransferase family protein [candidate division WOR-3 bacterium]
MRRFRFLDLLKAYAVIMMIQGHTLDAVLNPEARQTGLYQFMYILRGLTAPAFLIASGCGLAFSICRKRNLKRHEIFKQRILRIFPILIAGYFLHLPRFSLYQLLTQTSKEEIMQFFQCDILQTIGWTILLLQIILIFVKEKRVIITGSIIGVLLVLYFTPAVNNSIKSPNFFTQLLTPKFGSNFPLFPFASYLIFGLLFGMLFYEVSQKIESRLLNILIFISGCVFFGSSFLMKIENFNLFYLRTGLLLILISVFLLFEFKTSRILDFFGAIGQESFLIYIVHIIIVYGSVLNVKNNFAHYFGPTLNAGSSILLALSLIVFMLAMGHAWHYFKTKNSVASKILKNCLIALILLRFLLTI